VSPAWAMRGGIVVPQPLRPAHTGLVQFTVSDSRITFGAPTRVVGWGDQSGHAQDWIGGSGGGNTNYPYILGDDIDGKPLITFGTAADANKILSTVANFKDRFGVDMDGAAPRTIYQVVKPKFDAAFARMGGSVWSATSWIAQFFFDPTGIVGPVDGAYAWGDVGGDYVHANNFTPQDGSALGPYNNTPFLLSYYSAGRPDLEFRINNVPITLAPTAMHGSAGAASRAFFSSETLSFLGGATENLVYDFDQRTAPSDEGQTLDYLQANYPSIVIVR